MKHFIIDGHYQSQTLCRKIELAVAAPQQQLSVWTPQACEPQQCTRTARGEVGGVSQASESVNTTGISKS